MIHLTKLLLAELEAARAEVTCIQAEQDTTDTAHATAEANCATAVQYC